MPTIKWVGLQKWDREYPDVPVPGHAVPMDSPENPFKASVPFGIFPMLLCFAALIGKRLYYGEFPLDRRFVFVGILCGLMLIPIHEFLHAVCFPHGATVYVGISPEKFAAFAVCFTPVSKKRFMVMSLMPVLLGLIPLVLFLAIPISWKIPAAILWPAAMIGMISPSPDYMDAWNFGKAVPRGAFVQSSNRGWYWYQK